MSPATVWTELTVADAGWLEGLVDYSMDPLADLYVDVLFEGTLLLTVSVTPYTELSIASTAGTELSLAAATVYTELTL